MGGGREPKKIYNYICIDEGCVVFVTEGLFRVEASRQGEHNDLGW